MKNWSLPIAAIAGFFVILSLVLNSIGHSTSEEKRIDKENSKIDQAVGEIANQQDTAGIKVAPPTRATVGEKVPAWGFLKATTAPSGSLSFKGTQAGISKDTKNAKIAKKNKKKKKKKAQEITKKAKKANKSHEIPLKKENESSDSGVGVDYAANQNNKSKDPNALPSTADEWFEKITVPLSNEQLMEFIKLYNAKLVSEEIYYAVCEKLIKAPNSQIRKFGYVALGTTPSLNSFVLLAIANENENVPELQTDIAQNLRTYTSYQFVVYLPSALNSSEQEARLQAALTLGQSAQLNLHSVGGSGQNLRGRPSTVSHSQFYKSLLPLLEQLASSDKNYEIRSAAAQSSQIIRTLTQSISMASN